MSIQPRPSPTAQTWKHGGHFGLPFSNFVCAVLTPFNDITDERYLIKVLTPGAQDMKLIISIDDASIKAAESIEIWIEP